MRRLNTYNTVQVQSLPASDVAAAKHASVVAFASPSAVKAWLACVGDQDSADVAIACIGAHHFCSIYPLHTLRSFDCSDRHSVGIYTAHSAACKSEVS